MASNSTSSINQKVNASRPPLDALGESRALLALEGMTCASCAMRIEKGLKKVPGVKDANVNLATELATVTYDPAQTNLEEMMQKVEAVGYKATPQTTSRPETMPVGNAGSVSGVPVMPAGGLFQQDEQSKRKAAEIIRKRNLLILGIVFTLPVVILSMFFMNRFPGENYLLLLPTAILSPLIPFLRENAPIFAAAAMALSSVTVVSNS